MNAIRFTDFSLISMIYKNKAFFDRKVNRIRTDFDFKKDVSVYCYHSFKELECSIHVHIPKWVTGASDGNNIHLLLSNNINNSNELDYMKIILHEFTHVALYHYSRTLIPFWLDEGIALFYAGQIEREYDRDIVVDNNLSELTYSDCYYLFMKVIEKFSFEFVIAHIKEVADFSSDDILGEENIKKILNEYMANEKRKI